jgi:CRISPR-associated exonuclease Cas4
MNNDLLVTLIVGACLLAIAIMLISSNEALRRQATSASSSTILYERVPDQAHPLVAHAYGLEGQPTLIIREGEQVSVILDRAGDAPPRPLPGDVIQVAAECIVAEEALGETVQHGVLRFANGDIGIPLTSALRSLVLRRLEEMRACEGQGPQIAQQDPAICQECGYRAMCPIGRMAAPAR